MGFELNLEARRKDGSTFPVEISLTPLPTPDGPWVLASILDISARRAAEARVSALSRAHLALADLNAAILRAWTPDDLFTDACRIIQAASAQVGAPGSPSRRTRTACRSRPGPASAARSTRTGVDPLAALPALAQRDRRLRAVVLQ